MNDTQKETTPLVPFPVAIVGIGCIFPKAPNLKEYWRLLWRGQDAIGPVPPTHWSAADYYDPDPRLPDHVHCQRGGFIDPVDFDPTEFGIPPSVLEATDTSQLLSLVAARMALGDAGYGPGQRAFDRDRTAVVLGVTGTQELVIPLGARLGHPLWRRAMLEAGIEPEAAERAVALIAEGYVGWQEASFPGLLGNVVAGRISNRFDLGGTNCAVDAACASSFSALNLSLLELWAGRNDMVLTGGADLLNDIFMHMCFAKTQILSPSGDARPFAANADGTVLGEGVGILVLKPLALAERDRDRIYAVIRGIGTASDGRSSSIYAPRPKGQELALGRAYASAGIAPDTVTLVEGHGTGTRVGDQVEVKALSRVFGNRTSGVRCALGSVKSMIGHTKAAAGAAGLIKGALALYHKVLPPTLKIDSPDPGLGLEQSPFYLNTAARPWVGRSGHPRRCGVSAFGFGGSNFHVVLEEYEAHASAPAWDHTVQLMALGAEDQSELKERVAALRRALGPSPTPETLCREVLRQNQSFTAETPVRLAGVLDAAKAVETLEALDAVLETPLTSETRLPQGFFHGSGPAPGKLAVLFPGQGSQYSNMARDLCCVFPKALDAVASMDAAFDADPCLADLIFPPAEFQAEAAERQALALQSTDRAQPAIGAVSLGWFRVLTDFGLDPDALAGHSFGELTALAGAGWIDDQTFASLAVARGKAMADAGRQEGDPGAMLAVKAPLAALDALSLPDPDLVLANRNSPNQAVFAGPTAAIERLAGECRQKGWGAVRLPVAAAFHSRLIDSAHKPFKELAQAADFKAGRRPVYGNTHAQPYPDEPGAAARTLADQMRRPVDFVGLVENMYADGVRIFLEVGPKRVLTGLVRGILGSREHAALAVDRSNGRGCGINDLALTLAALCAMGVPLNPAAWEEAPPDPPPQRMRIPLSGANHRPRKTAAVKPDFAGKAATKMTAERPEPAPHPAAPLQSPTQPGAVPNAPESSTLEKPEPMTSQKTPMAPSLVSEALKSVQAGLRAIEAMQAQTAQAHQKFLEVQLEAGRTLAQMMTGTRQLSDSLLGKAAAPLEPPPQLPATVSEPPQVDFQPAPKACSKEAPSQPPTIERPACQNSAKSCRTIDLQPAAPAPPSKAPAPQGGAADSMAEVAAVVAELTGYPIEMLNADLEIESDLGIDSIKRVEILSALEERGAGLPAVAPEEMAALRTLGDIARALAPAGVKPQDQAAPVEPIVATQAAVDSLAPGLAEPPDTIEDLDASAPRRFVRAVACPVHEGQRRELAPGAAALVAGDQGMGPELAAALEAEGVEAKYIDTAAVNAVIEENLSPGPVNALIWVAPADPAADRSYLKRAFALTRRLSADLGHAARNGGALLATVARLDGAFGFLGGDLAVPGSGALAGLVKTAALEFPAVSCRALDMGSGWPDDRRAALALARELKTTHPHDPVEIGLKADGRRYRLVLEPAPYGGPSALTLPLGANVVVSGGARGVTAEALLPLARAIQPVLHLLGRSPLPDKEPSWLAGVDAPAAIQQAILAHEMADGRATPRQLAERARRILAQREIRRNLERLTAAGAKVVYHSVDVRQGEVLGPVLNEVRAAHGPIRALIHAAGALCDRRIQEKSDAQFDLVFDTKVEGFFNLLEATAADPLDYVVIFSSVAARTGNPGQADYAMANELLNKAALDLARQRPQTRVLSINWGPWDGGMVDAGLKRHFEAQGVRLLDPKAGAAAMARAMGEDRRGPVEMVVGSVLGDNEVCEPVEASTDGFQLAFAAEVGLESHPVLADHVLGGQPVVPLALMMEWLGHTALHANPGLNLVALEDLRLLSGIKINGRSHPVRLMNGPSVAREGLFEVPVALFNGNGCNGSGRVHSRARALLADALPSPPPAEEPLGGLTPFPLSVAEAYAQVLFHGKRLHGIRRINGCSDRGMVARLAPAPAPGRWIRQPLRSRWITDPLVLDAAFQMAILWCYALKDAVSLPTYAQSYRQYCRRFPADGVTAELRVRDVTSRKFEADFTFLDERRRVVAALTGFQAAIDAGLADAFKPSKAA